MRPLVTAGVVAAAVAVTVAVIWVVVALAPPTLLDALSRLGPVATGLVAVFALIVGISTIRQKQSADAAAAEAERRDQWWKRAQWTIDRLFEEPDDRQVVAWRILYTLAESNLAGVEELAIFDAVVAEGLMRLNPAESEPSDDRAASDNDGGDQKGVTS